MSLLADARKIHALVFELPDEKPEEAGRIPFPRWCTEYLPDRFKDDPSRLHHWIDAKVEDLRQHRGQKVCAIAPRGSAKTTRGTIAHALYASAYRDEDYILIISDTSAQTKQLLANVAQEAEQNDTLRAAFSGIAGPGPVWRQDELVFPNGVTVGGISTGGKIRGRLKKKRPTLIIGDDLQNLDHITSAIKRDRSWKWLTQDVEYAGGPETNFFILGTALHRECIVCKLQTQPGWRAHLFKGVEAWPERMDLWKEWEGLMCDHDDPDHESKALAYFDAHRAEMEHGHQVLWKQRFSLYDLMLKRLSTGQAAFEFEQQGNPVDPSLCEWPAEYFDHPQFWFDEWPTDLQVKTLYLDPSKGKSDKSGDYQAYVAYGRDRNGVEYLEADLRRQDVAAMVHTGIEWFKRFRPERLGIEKEAWQELLASPFLEVARSMRLEIPIALLPTGGVPKEVRIRRLTQPLSQRRLRFKRRSQGTALLVQQLRDFPHGEHDDGPDAAEGARRLAVQLFNKEI